MTNQIIETAFNGLTEADLIGDFTQNRQWISGRQIGWVVVALALVALTGCEDDLTSDVGPPPGGPHAVEIGLPCDLEAGCGSRELVCQPQWDGGELYGSICMLAQGTRCTPNVEFSLCGRGLECVQSKRDPSTHVCLPVRCVSSDECGVDQVCSNGKCTVSSSCRDD